MSLALGEWRLPMVWQQTLETFQTIEKQEQPKRLKSNFITGYNETKVKVKRRSI